ncbi:MAG: hypothetical protein ACRC2K_04170 [Clostridium sp.]
MDRGKILEVNKLVFEYILSLDDKDINGLLSGEVKLALEGEVKEKPKAVKVVEKKSSSIVDNAVAVLNSSKVREDGVKALSGKGYTVSVLKEIAKVLSVYITQKAKKQDIIDAIIEGTIGQRINLEVLREG